MQHHLECTVSGENVENPPNFYVMTLSTGVDFPCCRLIGTQVGTREGGSTDQNQTGSYPKRSNKHEEIADTLSGWNNTIWHRRKGRT